MAKVNREFVMLAEVWDRKKHRSAGMYLSEKLDGMRALWLPHTRGKHVGELSFANRGKDKRDHVATGLWSRYGKVIHCPEWFTEGFPDYPLDGELWAGPGKFQETMSVCRAMDRGDGWKKIVFAVFDAPCYTMVFADGRINNPNYSMTMKRDSMLGELGIGAVETRLHNFDANWGLLKKELREGEYVRLHEQRLLPFNTDGALREIETTLDKVLENGGEGLMLRHPASRWEPVRSGYLRKITPLLSAEARVIGYNLGERGKLEGMLGSLIVEDINSKAVFELSGFTDDERWVEAMVGEWGKENPGGKWPGLGSIGRFPLGTVVSYRYRELTDGGIPKSARYWRKHEQG